MAPLDEQRLRQRLFRFPLLLPLLGRGAPGPATPWVVRTEWPTQTAKESWQIEPQQQQPQNLLYLLVLVFSEIDNLYLVRSYYIVPDGKGQKDDPL